MTEPTPLIHVIDDDDSVRKALTRLLKAAGYEVRSFANSGEFLMSSPDETPGCVVLDIQMPGPSGLELQEAINKQSRHLPIIFLTGHGDIPMSVRAMKAGAVDFLTKPVQRRELLSAVENALARDRTNRSMLHRSAYIHECFESLSAREREILGLVVEGKLNKQIASALGIAERTVKAHRAQMMVKMQVDSLAELVRVAGQLQAQGKLP
jgi:FixJ family two-component response regulator